MSRDKDIISSLVEIVVEYASDGPSLLELIEDNNEHMAREIRDSVLTDIPYDDLVEEVKDRDQFKAEDFLDSENDGSLTRAAAFKRVRDSLEEALAHQRNTYIGLLEKDHPEEDVKRELRIYQALRELNKSFNPKFNP